MEDVFMIGKKLKQLRLDHKYTQEAVAIDLGVASTSTYSDYERGVVNVPAAVVLKAAEFYKKDLGYLYSLRGPVSITMNDQASNGYVEQQHMMDERFVKIMTEQMAQVIRDQAGLLKENQVHRARMMELLAHWSRGQGKKKGAE